LERKEENGEGNKLQNETERVQGNKTRERKGDIKAK
jgi:hypothetical protein